MYPSKSFLAALVLACLPFSAQAECLSPETFEVLKGTLAGVEAVEQEGRSPDYAETIRAGDRLTVVEAVRPNRMLSYVVIDLGGQHLIRGYFETYDIAAKGVSTTGSFEALATEDGTLIPLCGESKMGPMVTEPILELLPQISGQAE
ncbi:hypothetical protein [Litoreibacter arenae]|uniref:Uncharacterized protein n=1 Tax=Litoreibacter arenae DSM 19593 TaxID=1123360 RepID=S9QB77_9RHOB|nr:hypothetical protein [Litoreibacter arenae]EPX77212.1 hypothetical protein thalar_02934 [Litoreibacter arenae DSM 19593]